MKNIVCLIRCFKVKCCKGVASSLKRPVAVREGSEANKLRSEKPHLREPLALGHEGRATCPPRRLLAGVKRSL